MFYLQNFMYCVDLRLGCAILALIHMVMDFIGTLLVAILGESGRPDLCHRLFIIFMMIHFTSCLCLLCGTGLLMSSYVRFYNLMTLIKILALFILFISDIILDIWSPVLYTYVVMFFISIYFWLVSYSFYAALGGALFI
ncbi:hypothetical protein KR018_008597 [Drosophila ironensis]|nr:hypothetical protein KR018_008597 [Drosophila ironensis]